MPIGSILFNRRSSAPEANVSGEKLYVDEDGQFYSVGPDGLSRKVGGNPFNQSLNSPDAVHFGSVSAPVFLGNPGTPSGSGNPGGTAGSIRMNGGEANEYPDGSSDAPGNSGSIDLSGGGGSAEPGGHGGSIIMAGHGVNGSAGSINTSGAEYTAGGSINTSAAGWGNGGGSIDTSGGPDGPGGSIDTSNGGGYISTRGTGVIGLGGNGTRTTVAGTATSDRTISFPDKDGTVALLSDVGIPVSSGSFVVVQVTSDPTTNGNNLLAAYVSAKSLTPSGAARSSANRAVVIIPPASYDLGINTLILDTEYVDLVGLTKNASHVFITSSNSIATVVQPANDVKVIGITLHNAQDGLSWSPSSNLSATYWENVVFASPMVSTQYSGTFINCKSGDGGFGVEGSGPASGTFVNCTAGISSFGGGSNGSASGSFSNCTAGGMSFGGGNGGSATGTFTNCTAWYWSFGGGAYGNASGTFNFCVSSFSSFGSGQNSVASGVFNSCRMNGSTFRTLSRPSGVTTPIGYINCIDGNGNLVNGSA